MYRKVNSDTLAMEEIKMVEQIFPKKSKRKEKVKKKVT